jgi:hypothetical protein
LCAISLRIFGLDQHHGNDGHDRQDKQQDIDPKSRWIFGQLRYHGDGRTRVTNGTTFSASDETTTIASPIALRIATATTVKTASEHGVKPATWERIKPATVRVISDASIPVIFRAHEATTIRASEGITVCASERVEIITSFCDICPTTVPRRFRPRKRSFSHHEVDHGTCHGLRHGLRTNYVREATSFCVYGVASRIVAGPITDSATKRTTPK